MENTAATFAEATAICFSPSGATQKILQAVLQGLRPERCQFIDMTAPSVRSAAPPAITGQIVLLGVPVYGLGVPKVILPFLSQLRGAGQPAVLIAVYGNVGYGGTLLELSTLASAAGFKVIAAGAFVAEHSFSTQSTPIATGRPNPQDLQQAEAFGREIMAKLRGITCLEAAALELPRPKNPWMRHIAPRLRRLIRRDMGGRVFTRIPVVDPGRCNHCGACARRCPMGAIDPQTLSIDAAQCLHCFSCAKRCPNQARAIRYRPQPLVARFMAAETRVEKAPKIYL